MKASSIPTIPFSPFFPMMVFFFLLLAASQVQAKAAGKESATSAKRISVAGQITDRLTQRPINAVVEVTDLDNKLEHYVISTEEHSGSFSLSLQPNVNYQIITYAAGYKQKIISASFGSKADQQEAFAYVIGLEAIDFQPMHFKAESNELEDTSFPDLLDIMEYLLANPQLHVRFEHSNGNDTYAQEGYASRARSLRDFMINSGITPDRINYGNDLAIGGFATMPLDLPQYFTIVIADK